jgi:hypothetical protein
MSVQLLKAQFLLPLLPVKKNMLALSFSWRGNGEELYILSDNQSQISVDFLNL